MTCSASRLSLSIANRVQSLAAELDQVEAFLAGWSLEACVIAQVMIIVDEIASNIIKAAWPLGDEHMFNIDLTISDSAASLMLVVLAVDDGVAFDPTEIVPPDLDAELDERGIGGLGLFLVQELSESIKYIRVDGQNRLEITKRIERPSS